MASAVEKHLLQHSQLVGPPRIRFGEDQHIKLSVFDERAQALRGAGWS